MKCHILFFVLSALCVLGVNVNASLVEINDTTFASLPPLYGLDDWSRCQQPGDVFCIVDAELIGNSDVLELLKEYSAQTLKHYNRSHIHRGVCVTRCELHSEARDSGTYLGARDSGTYIGARDSGTWELAAQKCVNESVWNEYGLQASVLSVGHCTSPGGMASTTSSRALGVTLLVLVALACVATVLHVVSDRCEGAGILQNKYLLSFSLKQNWEILTYDRSKPRQDDRMKDLACLEGVRVMAIQCVIFSHVIFMYVYSYTDNPQYIEQMFDQFGWQTVLNSPLWLQAFFALSAFLTTYTLLVCSEKKPFTLLRGAVAIATRYVRLTPAAMFSLWFTISWFPRLGAGPLWGWLAVRESVDCTERWIPHLFMVHNYLPTGKFCMGHTWYIAADMQLHILGILLLLVFLRHRRLVYPVLGIILLGSVVATTVVAWLYDIRPIVTAQAPESLRTLFAGSKLISILYVPSYMNLVGYVCGMAVAFILHDNQKNGVKLQDNKLFNLLFHLSLTLGSAVVMCGTVFLHDAPPSRTAAALTAGCERALTAVCFSVFMLGAVSRCRSAVRDMFDWHGFHTLGRLSYCAFLIHFIVLRLALGSDTRMMHVSILACISLFITASVLTYLVAIPLCLLVELPFTQLWKVFVDGDKPAPRQEVEITQQNVGAKPFDLVANVRRPEVRIE